MRLPACLRPPPPGELPPNLIELATRSLSIANNSIASASLPAAWASPRLRLLDVSANELAGLLPPSWGETLPALERLQLAGGSARGPIPGAWWRGGFADGAVVRLRPDNSEVCGAVMPPAPSVYGQNGTSYAPSDADRLRTGGATASILLTETGLFAANASVTLLNWLGPCILQCVRKFRRGAAGRCGGQGGRAVALPPRPAPRCHSRLVSRRRRPPPGAAGSTYPPAVTLGGLPWPPVISTNVFDLSWQYGMAASDLLRKNPGVASLPPGSELADLPCYAQGAGVQTGYYGGDVAFGMVGVP